MTVLWFTSVLTSCSRPAVSSSFVLSASICEFIFIDNYLVIIYVALNSRSFANVLIGS